MNAKEARSLTEANTPTPNVEAHLRRFEGFVHDAASLGRDSIAYPKPPDIGAAVALGSRIRARGFRVVYEATCIRVWW